MCDAIVLCQLLLLQLQYQVVLSFADNINTRYCFKIESMKYCYMSNQEGFNKSCLNKLSNQIFKCKNNGEQINESSGIIWPWTSQRSCHLSESYCVQYCILPTVKLSRAITEPLSPDCMLNPYVLFICDLLCGGVDCLHSELYLIKRMLNVFQWESSLIVCRGLRIPC